MGGICGWIGERKTADTREILLRAGARLGGGALEATSSAALRHTVVAAGQTPTAAALEFDGITIALCGNPCWIDHDRRRSLSEFGQEFATRYRERGHQILETLTGDFAIALIDQRIGEGFIAVDPFSVRTLAYCVQRERLVFGSTLDALAVCAEGGLEIDPQSIYDYVFFHMVPGPQTIYRGVRRVAPGHYVRFDAAGRAEEIPFRRAGFVEDRRMPLEELKAQFISLLERATRRSLAGRRCGAFLSGGTDSSTVSGMIGRITGQPAETFAIGFGAAGYDEMEYARLAARHFRTRHHEYYVTPGDVVDAAGRIAGFYDQPFGNASAVPTYYCARMAAESGIERLLAGDGGDELFGGNARYAKQQLFAYYERLPLALRSALIEPPLLKTDITRRLPLVRKVRRYVEQAIVPMPQRYESGNQVDHIGAETIFESDFLGSVELDHPHRLMREAHAPFADCSLINQMLGIDFRFILADGDLPKVTRMCELAGVEVAFPMLDAGVVDFAAHLPPDMKLRHMRLRWFFKEALRDFLPREIILKKKHGFGLPFGVWLVSNPALLELANESLERLRPRGIFRPAFLDDLRGRLLHDHPGYYGALIWVLMMLSLWLDSRRL